MLAVAGGIILLECSSCCRPILLMLQLLQVYFTNAGSCWWDNFTRMQQLLPAYFTNAGSCWWDNFTKIQLLLHAYFTNAGSCWWVHFTGMQHFLGPYFTIARWETQPIWDNLTTFLIWLYLTVISGLSIASGSGICAWPS